MSNFKNIKMQHSTYIVQKLREKFLNQHLRDFHYSLPQSILNIQDKTRSNIFKWRGQFSPQLIENLILTYCPKNANILDPFVGSGTVIYESACFGLQASGCEINLAAFILSRTYQLMNLSSKQRAELISLLTNKLSSYFPQPILFNMSDVKELVISEFQESLLNLYKDIEYHEKIILDTLIILLDLGNYQISTQHLYDTFYKLCVIIQNLPYTETKN